MCLEDAATEKPKKDKGKLSRIPGANDKKSGKTVCSRKAVNSVYGEIY
jgi:hypothetical protein